MDNLKPNTCDNHINMMKKSLLIALFGWALGFMEEVETFFLEDWSLFILCINWNARQCGVY